MRPAGLVVVQAPQADGRWDRAYAGPATIGVPEYLAAALGGRPHRLARVAGVSAVLLARRVYEPVIS